MRITSHLAPLEVPTADGVTSAGRTNGKNGGTCRIRANGYACCWANGGSAETVGFTHPNSHQQSPTHPTHRSRDRLDVRTISAPQPSASFPHRATSPSSNARLFRCRRPLFRRIGRVRGQQQAHFAAFQSWGLLAIPNRPSWSIGQLQALTAPAPGVLCHKLGQFRCLAFRGAVHFSPT